MHSANASREIFLYWMEDLKGLKTRRGEDALVTTLAIFEERDPAREQCHKLLLEFVWKLLLMRVV